MKSSGYAVFSLVACGIPAGAMAQGANEELRSGNEAIVVTATRQPLLIERVPGSVLLLDETALEQAEGATGAEDLAELLPGVEAAVANGTQVAFQIRGIGAVDHQALTPTAAAVYLDGVFQATNVQTSALLYDLERVEVLRGPQGTLFGRNATSGVVNVVTAKPELGSFGGAGEFEYGNYNSIKVKGMLNVPLGDTIAFRAAGFYLNRDGFTRNTFDNSRIDDRDMYAIRGSLRWEPGADTTIDLMGYYFREDDNRMRIQKQLCQRDPTGVLGCLNNRRDFAKTNANSTFTGTLGSSEFLTINGIPGTLGLNSLYGPDAYANFVEAPDVRVVNTEFTPEYFTDELQLQAHYWQVFQFGKQ